MAHAQIRAAKREISINIIAGLEDKWFGTADQLTAEGLIPPGFKWPTDHGCKWWEAVGFRYIIVRDAANPKGPDIWCLRRSVLALESLDFLPAMSHALERNKASLRNFNSPATRLEERRFGAAQLDASFQSFKALAIGGAQ
jgi:hypothetical protein